MNQAALVKKRRKKIQNQRLKQVLYDFYVRLVVFWLKSWAKTLIMKYQFYSVISGPFILILHVKNMSRNHIVTILVCFFFFWEPQQKRASPQQQWATAQHQPASRCLLQLAQLTRWRPPLHQLKRYDRGTLCRPALSGERGWGLLILPLQQKPDFAVRCLHIQFYSLN